MWYSCNSVMCVDQDYFARLADDITTGAMHGWSSENTNDVLTEQHLKELIRRLEDHGCLQPEQTDTLGAPPGASSDSSGLGPSSPVEPSQLDLRGHHSSRH